MYENENPCLTCPDTCCALKGDCGLRLSQDEFEAYFRRREQDLNVRGEDGLVIISTKENLVCPNLGEKGCRIYDERPIDCRLYPYQMIPVYTTKRRIKFLLHLQSECVAGRTLHIPEDEAIALVEAFGRKVHGDRRVVVRVFENKFLQKLRNRCEVLLVRLCKKLRADL